MRSEIPSLQERLERAKKNQRALRQFLDREHAEDFELGDCLCNGDVLSIRLSDNVRQVRAMKRAQSAQLDTAGSYLVPQTFAHFFEEALLYASALRDWATIVPTERGGEYKLPTVDDTANEGSIVGENQLPPTTDVTTFGSVSLYTQKFSSNWFSIPFELIEDSPGIVEEKLARAAARRIGRLQNTTFTAQLLPQMTVGVTTASATAIAGDELINLYFSIDPAYRESPGFCWQMNNATLKSVRELKDAQGRYLFKQRRHRPDEPDLLLGKPVVVNRDMPTVAAGNITVAAGDFSKVVIRDVGREVRLKVADERFADFDQVGIVAFMRSEAALTDAGTHPVQCIQQHS